MNPTCLECSGPLLGRADKKFCDDQCRTAYHNKQNKYTSRLVRNINRQLIRNRRILEELWQKHPQQKVPLSVLYETGYDFRYSTHTRCLEPGQEYVFCYDLGLAPLENEQAFLLKRDPG